MNKQMAVNWMNRLKTEWIKHNINGVLDLFSSVEEYYEGPFSPPVNSREDVYKLWEETTYQDIEVLTIDLIAYEEGKCAMRWHLKYTDERDKNTLEMDGTYEVRFNDAGNCIYFVQWWVMAY